MSILKKFHSLVLLVFILTVSCQPTSQIDYILFSGTITNTDGAYVTVKGNDFSYDIDLNADGTFSDTLKVERGYHLFYSGRERTNIFLDKGYSINLSIDQPMFDETLTFKGEGKGTQTNNYLANKARLDEELTVDFQSLFSQEEAPFSATLQDWKSKMNELLAAAGIDDNQFVSLEQRNIEYEYLAQFVNYEYYHQHAVKDSEFKVSENFNKNLTNIDLSSEADFNTLRNYKNLIQSYFGAMIQRGEIEEAFTAMRNIESSTIKQGIIPSFIYDVEAGNENAEAIYNGIVSISTDSVTISKLSDKIEKIRKLQAGMPSATFAYQSINGETVTLKDLRGKYLYVDVWATWCGPCLREIPSLKSLENDYHDARIEFVSISIDVQKDFEKWQQMIADKELKGVQLFADSDWQSEFVKAYAIDGIPRFIIIDPEGNIVNPNAPRPSDPQIRDLFDEFFENS
ncbi:Thiol-disulfide isomerase or thioredoxin [Reichenbachiella faecimaris]|uniref:Thiol-disulfide isomerase or thioredoxin n=1 Tax=Reichenbachiella faecimaris TaxID=692418 RepID=A0A1W2G6N6_REIFA|nr:TlpA disulfide reductase family protein [Reichenbachiella faecimaris]SMD32339.1 Thiol-disulfide isomerase or thioredoxin [Reichenbachiella faecimaris]